MNAENYRLGVLVLAAGQSQRFGRCKLAQTWGGESMLARHWRQISACNAHRNLIMLGDYQQQLRSEVPVAWQKMARNWQQGMGSVLAEGVASLSASCSHILVTLGDQVALETSDFLTLIDTSKHWPEAIVCAYYNQQHGVPALFPAMDFPALMSMQGDKGAKAYIASQRRRVKAVALERAAIDIDTPQDWQQWCQQGALHD